MKQNTTDINSGIYIILCFCSGLSYIGSSSRLVQRLHEQIVMLKSNRHYNPKLQSDWLRFGGDCFQIFPVELVEDASNLSERESAWIDACNRDGGVYNRAKAITEEHRRQFEETPAVPLGEHEPGSKAKDYTFISPTGVEVKTKGLRQICAAYHLNESHMSKVARGFLVQHRGWKLSKGVEENQN